MIYLASPCYRSGEPECLSGFERVVASLARTGELANEDDAWDREPRDSNQARARNVLFHRALKNPKTSFFVTVDPDQILIAEMVRGLVAADRDVVVPIVFRKNLTKSPVGFPAEPLEQGSGLLRMRRIGFGVVCIKRHVIEKLTKDALSRGDAFIVDFEGHANKGERVAAIVKQTVHDGRWLAVDDVFSEAWHRLGGEMWAHSGFRSGHVGAHVF